MSPSVALVTDDRNRVRAQCRCTWRSPWITPAANSSPRQQVASGSLPGICTKPSATTAASGVATAANSGTGRGSMSSSMTNPASRNSRHTWVSGRRHARTGQSWSGFNELRTLGTDAESG